MHLPVLAGPVSTAVLAGSTRPMLHMLFDTRDLSSHSLGNITLASGGNAVHSVSVLNLPPGRLVAACLLRARR